MGIKDFSNKAQIESWKGNRGSIRARSSGHCKEIAFSVHNRAVSGMNSKRF